MSAKNPSSNEPRRITEVDFDERVVSLAAAVGLLPGYINEVLPDGRYVNVSDFKSALFRSGKLLKLLSKHRGDLVIDRQQASTLVQSLLLAQRAASPLLDEEHSIQQLLKIDHKELATAVREVKRLLKVIETDDLDFQAVQKALDNTRNPEVSRRVLPLVGPNSPTVSTSIGPLDLSHPQAAPAVLHCLDVVTVDCTVSAGLDEGKGMFEVQVFSVQQPEYSLIRTGQRYRVNLLHPAHRIPVLLGQLLKSRLTLTLQVDSAPLRPTHAQELKLSLKTVHLDVEDPALAIRGIAEQLQLDLQGVQR